MNVAANRSSTRVINEDGPRNVAHRAPDDWAPASAARRPCVGSVPARGNPPSGGASAAALAMRLARDLSGRAALDPTVSPRGTWLDC